VPVARLVAAQTALAESGRGAYVAAGGRCGFVAPAGVRDTPRGAAVTRLVSESEGDDQMDHDGLVAQHDIGLDLAQAMLGSVREAAAREGILAALAVCDRAGDMIAFARMDGAPLGATELAVNKAHTAALWQMRSGEFQTSTQPGGADWGLNASAGGRIVVYAGGVPVLVEGQLVGAVGMSGGTGEQDEACVLAGLAANGLEA
jgi:uncharacterized protein GlcG (DUF336 family)